MFPVTETSAQAVIVPLSGNKVNTKVLFIFRTFLLLSTMSMLEILLEKLYELGCSTKTLHCIKYLSYERFIYSDIPFKKPRSAIWVIHCHFVKL